MAPNTPQREISLVLFDGACGFCNSAIQFVIERDPEARFGFASLQSELGRSWAARAGVFVEDRDATMLLVEGGELFRRSDAALRVARQLGRGLFARRAWRLLAALGLAVPRGMRDCVYGFVARHRHQLRLTAVTCRLPNADEARRFLG